MALTDFTQLLEEDFSMNYWEDDRQHYAGTLLENMDRNDWARLADGWKARSERWQTRFAQTLDKGPAESAVPILIDMLESPSDEVALYAADSLRQFAHQDGAVTLTAPTVERLRAVARKSNVNTAVINDLLERTTIA
jgi:hypothetical protein